MRKPDRDRLVSVEISKGLHKLDVLERLDWLDPDKPMLTSNLPGIDLDRVALDAALDLDLSDVEAIDQWCDQFLKRRMASRTGSQHSSSKVCEAAVVWCKTTNKPLIRRYHGRRGLGVELSTSKLKRRSRDSLNTA